MSTAATTAAPRAATSSWTCSRCEMTVSWMEGAEQPDLPPHWTDEDEGLHCLACRRTKAVEQALEDSIEQNGADRAKLRTAALVDFELRRDPDRNNGVIARACRSSIPAVVKARARLD